MSQTDFLEILDKENDGQLTIETSMNKQEPR